MVRSWAPRAGAGAEPGREGSSALAISNLAVTYGRVAAVHDVSFEVAEGDCVALIGPNGNGKSSIVMGIAGLVHRRGRVEIFGRPAPANDVSFMPRHGFTLVPERRQLYPQLSVADNIVLGSYSRTRSLRRARASQAHRQALELFPELSGRMAQKAGTLSGGEQQMVAIARGLTADPRILAVDEPCLGLSETVSRRVYEALRRIHEAGRTLLIVEESPTRALQLATRQVEVRNGVVVRVKLGNLLISGIVTGSIYASFAACVALWYRVSNILNLAVGDFAMIGALGVDNLVRVHHWTLAAAIAAMLGAVVVAAYVYDRIVLRLAQDGITRQEGIVVTFFFTFALSFFIEGIAELLYGTDVHAAPAVWTGQSLSLGGGLHVDRAGVLVVAFAAVVGITLALVLRGTLQGKAIEACGENFFGARIVGIDNRKYRRLLFIVSALLACVFGILESPITGYTYNSGAAISLTGFIAAAFAGFQNPGKAVVAGLGIGVLEALLSGYVSANYADTILYALLAAAVLIRPSAMGLDIVPE